MYQSPTQLCRDKTNKSLLFNRFGGCGEELEGLWEGNPAGKVDFLLTFVKMNAVKRGKPISRGLEKRPNAILLLKIRNELVSGKSVDCEFVRNIIKVRNAYERARRYASRGPAQEIKTWRHSKNESWLSQTNDY